MKTPTEAQINCVENICKVLHIDFPQSSREFTRYCFSSFISNHIVEFYNKVADINEDPDFIYEYCGVQNDVWCEYY